MKMKKTAIVSALVGISMLLQSALPIFAEKVGWQANSNLTSRVDEGETIYRSNTGLAVLEYSEDDVSDFNTLSADFCYTGDATTGDREYVGIEIHSESDYYRFAIWPNTASNGPAVLFVQKNTEDPISRFIRKEMDAEHYGKGVWYSMEVTLCDNYFSLKMNGEVICTADSLGVNVGNFSWRRALLVSRGCPSDMKSPKLSYAKIGDDEKEKGWVANTSMTVEKIDGEDVWSSNNQLGVLKYNGDLSEVNSVSAEFCYTGDATTGHHEYVGIEVYSKSGTYYRFAIWPNTASSGPAVLLVQKDTDDPSNKYVRLEMDAESYGKGKWYSMKVMLEDDYLALWMNDELICTDYSLGIDIGKFEWESVRIVSRGCPAKMKSPALSKGTPDHSGRADFEFTDEGSVLAFGAQNADLSWNDGTMNVKITGSGAIVSSPEILASPGTKNSVKLAVRNTFVVRMSNDSAADRVKLYFKVKGVEDEMSKEFDILPHSAATTYYMNLSDVYDCGCGGNNDKLRTCGHYLKSFRLEFIGAGTGELSFEEISFSRESKIYEYAAESLHATASAETGLVSVSGRLLEKYAGKTVTVLETSVQNYDQSITYSGNKKIAQVAANGRDFSVTFDLQNGKMNHLSTKFIAVVSDGDDYKSGVKLSEVFMIENWRDFSENPYSFTTPELSVNVTDARFGAKGDGYTNDTDAIQAAIDYVHSQGGGKVVIPGDDSDYGRRYIMTGVELRSNVELNIESGAILWQSHDESHYTKYKIFHGHEDMGQDVAWGLSALMHLPFIYIHDAENVRVTGGGTIRMDDTGTEWLDGNGYSWTSNITVGCSSVIHLVPIGIYGCKNVEISDINVRRGSCWHAYIRESSGVYFGNVDLSEVNCINGDGFDFSTAVHDVVVDRCCLYSNDDALVLAVTTNDPRDDLSIWRSKSTTDDKSLYNFKIRNCNLFGGHGLTFIPWASDHDDQSKVEIYNIDVENCVLGGSTTAVGVWADNPFYGKSNYWDGTYGSTDATEDGDYSPIHDLRIVNNKYVSPCSFYGVDVTNVETDMSVHGASSFQNGNFDKVLHGGKGFNDESDYKTGLSYWSSSGNVSTELVGTKESMTVDTKKAVTQKDYAGVIDGKGELFQGLYLKKGKYSFKIDTKLTEGVARIFAKDAISGEIIAEKTIDLSENFAQGQLLFKLDAATNIQLGVALDDGKILIDNASIDSYSGEIPTDPVDPVEPVEPDEPEEPTKPPKTGTTTAIIVGLIGAICVAGIVTLFLIKKKRKK